MIIAFYFIKMSSDDFAAVPETMRILRFAECRKKYWKIILRFRSFSALILIFVQVFT